MSASPATPVPVLHAGSLLLAAGSLVAALLGAVPFAVPAGLGVFSAGLGALALARSRRQAADAAGDARLRGERFARLVETAPAGIVLFDLAGGIVSLNPAAETILGSAAAITGRAYNAAEWRILGIDDRPFPEEELPFSRVLRSLAPVHGIEFGLDRTDGKRFFLSADASPLFDPAGHLEGVVVAFRDITAQRQAEARYRMLFYRMQDGFALHELVRDEADRAVDYRFLAVNPAFERMTGIPAARAVGRTARELFPTLEASWVERYAEVVESGEPSRFEDYTAALDRWFSVVAFCPERGRFGAIFQDVTDRKRAEIALAEAHQRFAASFEEARDAILLAEVGTGRILDANRQAEVLLGRSRADLLGLSCGEIVPAGGGLFLLAPGQAAHGPVVSEAVAADGRRVPVEINASAFTLPDGRRVVQGIFRDISERRGVEERLRASEERLRQTEKMEAIGKLAGGIAHDFNNQLAGIMGYAELLLNFIEDEKLRGYAAEIISAARHSGELTRQLLTFSRKGPARSEAVDLHRLLDEAIGMLERSIDKRIRLCREYAAADATLAGDPAQLQNAFLNLGLNARDAMPEGGTLVFSTAAVEFRPGAAASALRLQPGAYLRVEIRDSGCGMEEEVRRRIFEPFFTTKAAGKGTGMGLASVYGAIQAHGGAIEVESEPGRGSVFRLFLPTAGAKDPAARPVRRDSALIPALRSARILVADDEEAIRKVAGDLLRALGYQIDCCVDGREAVEKFQAAAGAYDLVLLDLVMPRLDGRAALAEMRRLRPDVKVLVISGFDPQAEDEVAVTPLGAIGFLRKPFEVRELARRVAEAVGPKTDRLEA